MSIPKNVGIVIFNDADVLDFAGPFEVFSSTAEVCDEPPFSVFTLSENGQQIKAVNGLTVVPDYSFDNHPKIDILIVAGGVGTRKLLLNKEFQQRLNKIHGDAEYTLCICSAARVFGCLGLLDNKAFCTHHDVYDHLKEIAPLAIPQFGLRFIQSDQTLYTSGGISAGIDLSFYLIEQLLGKEIAHKTAEYMEYNLTPVTN